MNAEAGATLRDCCGVTAVGIVGAGRAATLHAEATRVARGVRLAGVTARTPHSAKASALSTALECPIMTMRELARASDVVVIATSPADRAEALAELASFRPQRAVLIESPAATSLDGIAAVESALANRPMMVAANLLHAPAVRRMLDAVRGMQPHHLELRLAVPDPARGSDAGVDFGGGVIMDPTAGFWPVLMAAMGAAIESVAVTGVEIVDGLDRAARVVLQAADGRAARADLRWGAPVAEAAIEAADSRHVARCEIWPVPVTEIDGERTDPPVGSTHALAALGFVAQIERLARVADGEAQAWPDLAVASSALTIATAAALSARRNGSPVNVTDVPHDASPFELLSGDPIG